MHLTNVAVQKTAPDYDPEKVCNSRIGERLCRCVVFLKFLHFNQFYLLFILISK